MQIGFGYVPWDLVELDMVNKRGAEIQDIVKQIIKGTYKVPVVDTGCSATCNIF